MALIVSRNQSERRLPRAAGPWVQSARGCYTRDTKSGRRGDGGGWGGGGRGFFSFTFFPKVCTGRRFSVDPFSNPDLQKVN